jgi:hypothetical protein
MKTPADLCNLPMTPRFSEGFDVSTLLVSLRYFYLHKFRTELFSEYLITPTPETIQKHIAQRKEELQKLSHMDSLEEMLVYDCFEKAVHYFEEFFQEEVPSVEIRCEK